MQGHRDLGPAHRLGAACLGQRDPLKCFTYEAVDLYERMEVEMDDAVRGELDAVRVDLGEVGIERPASTWIYVVSDNPFGDQIDRLLTGPGRTASRSSRRCGSCL